MRSKISLQPEWQVWPVKHLHPLGNDFDSRLILQLVIPPFRSRNSNDLVPCVLHKFAGRRWSDDTKIDLQSVLSVFAAGSHGR